MYTIKENKIFYDGKLIYEAPWTISSSESYNDNLIINYNIPPEKESRFSSEDIYENVLCINFNGQVKWRLPFPKKSTDGPTYQPDYHSMGKAKEGSFWASTGSYGHRFDPETGEILETHFTH